MKGLFHWSPSDFTWNPSMTRGLWSYTSSICAGIGAMTPAGRTEPSIVIDVSGRPHPVDEDLHLPGDAEELSKLVPRKDFARLTAALIRTALEKDYDQVLGQTAS